MHRLQLLQGGLASADALREQNKTGYCRGEPQQKTGTQEEMKFYTGTSAKLFGYCEIQSKHHLMRHLRNT